VVQGLSLAPVIRLLGVVGEDEEDVEEQHARRSSIRAGLEALERLSNGGDGERETVDRLKHMAASELEQPGGSSLSSSRLHLAMIAARREAVIAMRDRNEISDAVMRRLLSEFDHEEILLHQRSNPQPPFSMG
jgi:hypothetical protein